MIPDFEINGFLPAGIHWASWAEFEIRYGINSHRLHLLGGLKRAITSLTVAKCQVLFVDGSFVTRKEFPEDFDACWDPTGVDIKALDPVFLNFDNGRAAQKAKYYGELFPSTAGAQLSPFQIYLNFFQKDKDTGSPKGIVALNLTVTI